jgi:hypothetical protein
LVDGHLAQRRFCILFWKHGLAVHQLARRKIGLFLMAIKSSWVVCFQTELVYQRRVRAMFDADTSAAAQPVRPIIETPWDSFAAFTSSAYSKVRQSDFLVQYIRHCIVYIDREHQCWEWLKPSWCPRHSDEEFRWPKIKRFETSNNNNITFAEILAKLSVFYRSNRSVVCRTHCCKLCPKRKAW